MYLCLYIICSTFSTPSEVLQWNRIRITFSFSVSALHLNSIEAFCVLSPLIVALSRSEESESGIPGDGRCLFRSVVHGARLREGKPSPGESYERELADELREKVVEELIKRRADAEWFVEGDFDAYVTQMRQPHIWGGEPELLMSSHVLQAPITVYMWDNRTNCLKVIAEYGQEYGKDKPICVLYHGYGHYDALQNPSAGQLSKMNKAKRFFQ